MSQPEEVTVLSLNSLLYWPQSVTEKFPQTDQRQSPSVHAVRVELIPCHFPYILPKFQHNCNVTATETVKISYKLKGTCYTYLQYANSKNSHYSTAA